MLKQCAVDNDCQELYNRFQSRYRVDLEDVMAWDSERDGHERRRRFEETVRRIYEHGNQQSNKNNKNKSIAHPRYHLAINRFADQPPRFFSPTKTWHENDDAHLLWDAILDGGTENEHDVHTSKRQPQHLRSLQRQPEANENLLVPKGSDIHPFVVKLESEADIRNVVGVAPAVELGGKIHFPMPSKKHHKKKHYKTQRLQPGSVVNLPDMGPPVKYKLGIEVAESEKEYPFGGSLPALDSPEQGHEVNLRTKHSFQPTYHDKYAMSLNWATRHNPDRVPLVHDVFDQVRLVVLRSFLVLYWSCPRLINFETIRPFASRLLSFDREVVDLVGRMQRRVVWKRVWPVALLEMPIDSFRRAM